MLTQKEIVIIEELIQLRAERRKAVRAPKSGPLSLSEAYLWQDELIRKTPGSVVGWKVGATSPVGQQALGVSAPVAGPIFDFAVLASGADCALADNSMGITEPEFAFQMKADLPKQPRDYRIKDITPFLAGVAPALEIVDTRFTTGFGAGIEWIVADGTGNHAFIHGQLQTDITKFDYPSHSVTLARNGEQVSTGNGGAVLGDPLNVVGWLANHLAGRGYGLRDGDWISTGLTTEVINGARGDEMTADFGKLGTVSVGFS